MSADRTPKHRVSHRRAGLPFLDRLMEADDGAPEVASPSTSEALERLHAAVRRDLEALLNARRRPVPLPSHLRELPTSLLNYGIPDPTSGAFALAEAREELVREIERTIRRFEPRLTQVAVAIVRDDVSGLLRMKVEAVLRADPVPEIVSFETVLEPVLRHVQVREA